MYLAIIQLVMWLKVVEEARLESVYTPKGYRGFESRFLRNKGCMSANYATYTLFYTLKLDLYLCRISLKT